MLLFGELFYGLRGAGLKLGLSEWMALMEALKLGAIKPDLSDFYQVARALLIKTEAHFDIYDEVFFKVFGMRRLPPAAVKKLLDWLEDPVNLELTPEKLAQLEKLPLEELRRMFEERLAEQKKRHDGGNRWVGTGGTSPFGNGGVNPAGVRVGGGGGNRSAIQVASARKFRPYRNDRVIDTRTMAVALKKLRRLSRRHTDLELDIDETIDKTCRNAGELTLEFVPPRKNEARVLLLMDVGGSMDPYAHMVEQLFSAASGLNHWRKFEALAFHNCPYEKLEPGRKGEDDILTADLLQERPRETFLIFVGDAYMAPSELTEAFGAIDYYMHNRTPGLVWLHRLRTRFSKAIWLNPIPKNGWHGWTIKLISQLIPMFPLTLQGVEEGVDYLMRGTPEPMEPLAQMYPQFAQFEEEFP